MNVDFSFGIKKLLNLNLNIFTCFFASFRLKALQMNVWKIYFLLGVKLLHKTFLYYQYFKAEKLLVMLVNLSTLLKVINFSTTKKIPNKFHFWTLYLSVYVVRVQMENLTFFHIINFNVKRKGFQQSDNCYGIWKFIYKLNIKKIQDVLSKFCT